MGDQKHSDAMHHVKGLSVFFAVLDPVLPGETKGIAENLHGHLESDPVMLSLIEAVLGLVPGEAYCHGTKVVAILPMLKLLSDPFGHSQPHNPWLISLVPGSGVIKPHIC